MEVFRDTATECHLPYGITQCYLLPDTSEHTPPNPSHAGQYSIYLPRREGRLSWPRWLDSALAGSQTSNLSITSPTLNQCNHQDNQSVIKQSLILHGLVHINVWLCDNQCEWTTVYWQSTKFHVCAATIKTARATSSDSMRIGCTLPLWAGVWSGGSAIPVFLKIIGFRNVSFWHILWPFWWTYNGWKFLRKIFLVNAFFSYLVGLSEL